MTLGETYQRDKHPGECGAQFCAVNQLFSDKQKHTPQLSHPKTTLRYREVKDVHYDLSHHEPTMRGMAPPQTPPFFSHGPSTSSDALSIRKINVPGFHICFSAIITQMMDGAALGYRLLERSDSASRS
ncbi:hypothetical protein Bbelb_336300 [Branchiostoma belcheri]|nr:hypothetical protein Bbelb_336300 [Branchiostoma belcheri]